MKDLERECDARNCDECCGLIVDTFYRCETCSFDYVCCKECYKEERLNNKKKRTVKRKEYD